MMKLFSKQSADVSSLHGLLKEILVYPRWGVGGGGGGWEAREGAGEEGRLGEHMNNHFKGLLGTWKADSKANHFRQIKGDFWFCLCFTI